MNFLVSFTGVVVMQCHCRHTIGSCFAFPPVRSVSDENFDLAALARFPSASWSRGPSSRPSDQLSNQRVAVVIRNSPSTDCG